MDNYKVYIVSCKLADGMELELFPDSSSIEAIIEEHYPNVQVTARLHSTMLPVENKDA